MSQVYLWQHTAQDGKLFFTTADLHLGWADAVVINENWRRIQWLLNGNLSFCNFWPKWDHDYQPNISNIWPESWFALEPRKGIGDRVRGFSGAHHTHDGWGSSLLGEHTVHIFGTLLRGVSLANPNLYCPSLYLSNTGVSNDYTVCVSHAGTGTRSVPGASGATEFTATRISMALPWSLLNSINLYNYPSGAYTSTWSALQFTGCIASAVCPEAAAFSAMTIAIMSPSAVLEVYNRIVETVQVIQLMGWGQSSASVGNCVLILTGATEYE